MNGSKRAEFQLINIEGIWETKSSLSHISGCCQQEPLIDAKTGLWWDTRCLQFQRTNPQEEGINYKGIITLLLLVITKEKTVTLKGRNLTDTTLTSDYS